MEADIVADKSLELVDREMVGMVGHVWHVLVSEIAVSRLTLGLGVMDDANEETEQHQPGIFDH